MCVIQDKKNSNFHLISGWRREPGALHANHNKGVEGNYLWYEGKIAIELPNWDDKRGERSRKQK